MLFAVKRCTEIVSPVSTSHFGFGLILLSQGSITRPSYRLSILGTDLFTCNMIARPMADLISTYFMRVSSQEYSVFALFSTCFCEYVEGSPSGSSFYLLLSSPCLSFIRTFTHISPQIIKNNRPQRCLLPSSIPQAPP